MDPTVSAVVPPRPEFQRQNSPLICTGSCMKLQTVRRLETLKKAKDRAVCSCNVGRSDWCDLARQQATAKVTFLFYRSSSVSRRTVLGRVGVSPGGIHHHGKLRVLTQAYNVTPSSDSCRLKDHFSQVPCSWFCRTLQQCMTAAMLLLESQNVGWRCIMPIRRPEHRVGPI